MSARLLLVEDELHIARGLIFNLEMEGYAVTHTESGEEALDLLETEPFDLVVLDLMLPGISGFEVCREIRARSQRLPVLMLTAKGEAQDRIHGLAIGADDYLTKPFSLDEFLMRVRGMLRRSSWYRPDTGRELRFGENRVDLESGAAVTGQGELTLTEQELRLLRAFADHADEVIERGALLQIAWGVNPDTETRTLDNFVGRLRRYFESNPAEPRYFLTVRGRGYRFNREGT